MKRGDCDEDVGDDRGRRDVGVDDGDLLRRHRAHRADGRTGDADAIAGERMRVDHRLGDDDRRQKQEDRKPKQAHRGQANTQFEGYRSNSGSRLNGFRFGIRGRIVGLRTPVEEIVEMTTSQAVREITDQDFEQLMSSEQPVFVDFWAPWCGPCRIIGPIVEELAPSYEGKAVITKMNVDENQNVPQKFGVTSIPTLMIFKNGQLVDRAIGAMPKPMLQKFIDKNI